MSDYGHASAAYLYAPYSLATAICPDRRRAQGSALRLAVPAPSTAITLQGRSSLLFSHPSSPLNPLHSLEQRQLLLHTPLHSLEQRQLLLYTPPGPLLSPSPSPSAPRQPLQHVLQPARIDQVLCHTPTATPSAAAAAAAVIVSPHYSPPPEREQSRPLKQKPFVRTALTRQQPDGHREQPSCVPTSAPNMTPNDSRNTNSPVTKRDNASMTPQRLQRPSVVSQHSNSVPSTPLQLARKYESRSRSPSPNGGLGSHSPRSVSSEANSTMPTLRLGRPYKCRYETNVGSLGRRRMPYESSDILDQPKEEPKKTLDPHEHNKLTGDMRELYDRLQPSGENTRKRDRFVQKVEHILETEFPGNLSKVHVFGSSGNMLYTTDSDGKDNSDTGCSQPCANAFDS